MAVTPGPEETPLFFGPRAAGTHKINRHIGKQTT